MDGSAAKYTQLEFDPSSHGNGHAITESDWTCLHPYFIVSRGVWDVMPVTVFSFTVMGLQILMICALIQFVTFLLKPLRQPHIVSQVMAGLIIGPPVLGKVVELRFIVFPTRSQLTIINTAMMGFTIFQFLVGVRMDPTMIFSCGRKALAIGSLSFVIPATLATTATVIYAYLLHLKTDLTHMLILVGAAQSMTTFPAVASMLSELKIRNSELGRLAMSSAMIGDQSYSILSLVSANWKLNQHGLHSDAICAMLLGIAYVAVIAFIVRPVFIWIIKRTPDGEPVKEMYITLILIAALASGFISIAIGQNAYFGPFILGLAVPDGPPLGTTLVNKLDPIVSGLLMPMFIALCGLDMAFDVIHFHVLKVVAIIIAVCLVGKIAGVLLIALYCRIPFRESLSLSLIMCGKGAIELAVYHFWLHTKIIDRGTFTVMLTSVAVVTGATNSIVRLLYDPSKKYAGYIKRTIQHARKKGGLRILTCVHEEDEVPSLIKLLEVSNPTRESPLYIHMVHLIELVGREAPVLANHYMWKKSSKATASGSIVNIFRRFNHQNQGVLSVQAFTTICPYETMHEDVCMLALDKETSLIVIPFHKRWTADGAVASTKPALRTLNSNVLERAPCSVAIFADRDIMISGLKTATTATAIPPNSFHVALLFLGGADDREALAYAQRMATDSGIKLRVVRLVAADDPNVDEWQKVLDDEALNIFQLQTYLNGNVLYAEIVTKDVEQTTAIIRSLENWNNLIIVGRRHGVPSPITAGFSAHAECPELGAMGDLLTSSTFQSRVSILVVQQQIVRTD